MNAAVSLHQRAQLEIAATAPFPSAFRTSLPSIMALGSSTTIPATIRTITGSYFYGRFRSWCEWSPHPTLLPRPRQYAHELGLDAEFQLGQTTSASAGTPTTTTRLVADYQTPATSCGINTGRYGSDLEGLPTINVRVFWTWWRLQDAELGTGFNALKPRHYVSLFAMGSMPLNWRRGPLLQRA